jgi:hypothetical protein
MRLALVLFSIVAALGLWVWATGPGTSLPLAIGGWIFCAVVGRVTFVLLKPRIEDGDTAPPPPPAQPPVHPPPRHRQRP